MPSSSYIGVIVTIHSLLRVEVCTCLRRLTLALSLQYTESFTCAIMYMSRIIWPLATSINHYGFCYAYKYEGRHEIILSCFSPPSETTVTIVMQFKLTVGTLFFPPLRQTLYATYLKLFAEASELLTHALVQLVVVSKSASSRVRPSRGHRSGCRRVLYRGWLIFPFGRTYEFVVLTSLMSARVALNGLLALLFKELH
jgi:hypothetical protein